MVAFNFAVCSCCGWAGVVLCVCRCYDATGRTKPSPPQGLQLVLSAPSPTAATHDSMAMVHSREVLADTVVMDNLGYFQLQVQPGVRIKRFPSLCGHRTMRVFKFYACVLGRRFIAYIFESASKISIYKKKVFVFPSFRPSVRPSFLPSLPLFSLLVFVFWGGFQQLYSDDF